MFEYVFDWITGERLLTKPLVHNLTWGSAQPKDAANFELPTVRHVDGLESVKSS